MNGLRPVSVFLVMSIFYASTTRGQGPCSQCKGNQCHPVRDCRDNSGRDCVTQYQCVKSNLILGQAQTCPAGGTPLLTRIMFLFTPVPCSPGTGDCQGPTLYCHNQICCSRGHGDSATTPGPVQPNTGRPCQPACRMRCEFGLQQDGAGCPVCACQPHPCLHTRCGQGEKCTVTQYPCGNRTCYAPKCIREVEPGRCPPLACNMLCPHGFATDPRSGCPVCQCHSDPGDPSDLCQQFPGFRCPAGRHCEMRELPCSSPPCTKAPMCVEKDFPCARTPCRMFCPHGFARDANNCEMCTCRVLQDCSQMTCGQGQECQIRNNEAVCVDKTPTPCARIQCRMFCPHGFARDANNCETCTCNRPTDCSQLNCGEGKQCQFVNNEPACVDKTPTPCARIQCRMFCPHGFARDANNCETCTCNAPTDCSQLNCGEGKQCQFVNNEPACVDKPQTPCGRVECRMFCPRGFARDANNCEICECNPDADCSQKTCNAGEECQMIGGEAVCVGSFPCSRIGCLLSCPHGYVYDSNNCNTCQCQQPDCSQMNCGAGQECQIIDDKAVCVAKPQTPCQRIQCRMYCPNGFARDANNCDTCQCNLKTDCSQMNCAAGQECKVISGEAVCLDVARAVCPRTQCRMYCPNGFARDANNCETCACNPSPDCSQKVCGAGQQCQILNNEAMCVGTSSSFSTVWRGH